MRKNRSGKRLTQKRTAQERIYPIGYAVINRWHRRIMNGSCYARFLPRKLLKTVLLRTAAHDFLPNLRVMHMIFFPRHLNPFVSSSLIFFYIKFSTLGQYFEEVKNELGVEGGREEPNEYSEVEESEYSLPDYQGDFFTYCDENEDYWSGYFTTRPFMKGLTRTTQAILRTGEALAALARGYAGESVRKDGKWENWFASLQAARRNVALFQHHDGVTGTARRAVVEDYAERLLTSLAQVAEFSSGNI